MNGAFITAIVFGGIVLSLTIIGATLLMGIKIIKGGVSRKQQRQQAEETQIIQEMYRQASRMEARIDALEAILLDRRKDNHDHET